VHVKVIQVHSNREFVVKVRELIAGIGHAINRKLKRVLRGRHLETEGERNKLDPVPFFHVPVFTTKSTANPSTATIEIEQISAKYNRSRKSRGTRSESHSSHSSGENRNRTLGQYERIEVEKKKLEVTLLAGVPALPGPRAGGGHLSRRRACAA
jgi:hypothetical protein